MYLSVTAIVSFIANLVCMTATVIEPVHMRYMEDISIKAQGMFEDAACIHSLYSWSNLLKELSRLHLPMQCLEQQLVAMLENQCNDLHHWCCIPG